jgi:hypothetical protein
MLLKIRHSICEHPTKRSLALAAERGFAAAELRAAKRFAGVSERSAA